MQPTDAHIAEYVARVDGPTVAVFDIGTKAARLLLAPRQVPAKWDERTFLNASHITNLGLGVNRATDELNAHSSFLNETIHFIQRYLVALRKSEVREISIIGTAIFRWLQNEQEIRSVLQGALGIDLQIIPQDLEGRLTLMSVPEIARRRGGLGSFRPDDTLLMVDQGGGSLEVSWLKYSEFDKAFPRIEKKEEDNLGTVALRQEFFSRDAKGDLTAPELNKAQIAAQTRRIGAIAERAIGGWRGLPRAHNTSGNGNLHAFAVGSGVTNIWPRKGSHAVHGRTASLEKIDATIAKRCAALGESNQQVMSVYKALMRMEGAGTKTWLDLRALDQDMALLYGLPVYRSVLKACGLEALKVSGYGLRYGYYLDRYQRLSVEPDASGPFVFVSYSHINPHYVYEDIFRMHAQGYRVWYDRGIRPSSDWNATLAGKIADSTVVCVFLTADAIASEHVYDEVFLAKQKKKTIVPILMGIEETALPAKFQMCLGATQCLKKRNDDSYVLELIGALPTACRRNA